MSALLSPRTDDDCPSPFDEAARQAFLDDEARFEDTTTAPTLPRWLRRDYRAFIARYLKAHGVTYRELSERIDKSLGFISYFLDPRQTGKRLKVYYLIGTDLEELLALLELPEVEEKIVRDLVCLEDARRRETGQDTLFRRRIDTAWSWQTNNLAHDQIIKYARDLRNVLVCEMTRLDGFRADARWMRNHMAYPFDGRITTAEIERAWQAAVSLKLVTQTPDGWHPAADYHEKILRSGTPRLREALKRYYVALIEASIGGLQLDSTRRYYEGRTVCIRAGELERIGDEMHSLLGDIREAPAGDGEAVVHVQMTAFTMADINGRPEELPPMRSGDSPAAHHEEAG